MQSVISAPPYRSLLLLIVLFGLPPAAGWFLIMNPQWLPDQHKNRGTLVAPPRTLQKLHLQDKNGQLFDWSTLNDHWTLVARTQGNCGSACKQQLYALQQIRRAVGTERIRIKRLLIQGPGATGLPPDGPVDTARGIQVLNLTADQEAQFKTLFSVPGIQQDGATYLVDPNGMLMMAYAASSPMKDILKDLETLLKASRNWPTGVNHGNG